MKCPKCQHAMELGVVGDVTRTWPTLVDSQRDVRSPVWYAGAIDGSFFIGTNDRRAIYVQTMRCKGYGFLESYAVEPPK